MNLYLISQDRNNGYDTYDSAVVAAETEEAAQKIPPNTYGSSLDYWTSPEYVQVEFLGVAKDGTKSGLILASFNAG